MDSTDTDHGQARTIMNQGQTTKYRHNEYPIDLDVLR